MQVTLEEQMICGALQTLNEEAFEDVVASERPSPTGGPSTGEMIALDNNTQLQPQSIQQSQQPLTPIQETVEHERSLTYSQAGTTTGRRQSHTISFSNNNNTVNINNNNNIEKPVLRTNECDCGISAIASNRSQHICNETSKITNINSGAEKSTNNINNNINSKLKNLSGMKLHETIHSNVMQQNSQQLQQQQHQLVSSSQSLSYQTNHLSSPSLLTLTNESTATSDNNEIAIPSTPTTSNTSTIILMPSNACADGKSFVDDTRL